MACVLHQGIWRSCARRSPPARDLLVDLHKPGKCDFANRLPRGRTYVPNGSVIHLGVEPGRVQALEMGTDLYRVDSGILPLAKPRWTEVKRRCAGAIDSLVELLGGSLSKGVMEVVKRTAARKAPSKKKVAAKKAAKRRRS